ncbi:sigma-70 family RNA polymerase sigma factor [Streptomyces sp. NPDC008086]|uniref:sigma-70 family RNA polymerase sigma factor n=1 Tax=Streptomyces sp. NPDC008086 TaxID=3364807 RepID=UPI0036ED706C
MSDGSAKVPAQATPPVSTTASYARIYEEQQPRLVAFARSLTRNNSWAAEDLVAEAHFRVWRRLSAGHEIENVPAYLMTTVRHLAATAGGETRETPHHDPQTAERAGAATHVESMTDPAEQVSSVDLLVRVLGQLPERWVQALWLAEAEGQPLETVGRRIGAKEGATAVLLHRAREGMRQAFLRSQTGAPDDPACEVHWVRMPAYVRGNATPRQSERLLAHVDACADCRGRLAVLMRANDRLPALVGPALLVLGLGTAGKFLLPLAAGSAGATAALGGQVGSVLHGVRQAVTGGGAGTAKVPAAVAAGATVTGMALAMVLAFGTGGSTPTPAPPRVPLAEAPVAQPSEEAGVGESGVPKGPGGPAGVPEVKQAEQRRADGGAEVVGAEVGGSGTAGAGLWASSGPRLSQGDGNGDGAGAETGTGTGTGTGAVVDGEPGPEVVPGPGPEVVPGPGPVAVVLPPPAVVVEVPGEQPPGEELPTVDEPPAVAEPAPSPAGPVTGPPADAPEVPETSEVPGTPEVPETSEPPETPEVPEAPAQVVPSPEQPEAPAAPTTPYAPGAETPAPPSPEPSTPTPVEPGPVEEVPEVPQSPDTPIPPATTEPDPAPQPAPGNPGDGCGN